MRILALDTSGSSQSAAALEDEQVLAESFDPHPSSHSETLLPTIESLLVRCGWKLEDIDLYAVTAGPGSFTGLRIGLSTVKGLCRAHPRPVAGISTLLAMAVPLLDGERLIIPCIDARCGEVYAAAYAGSVSNPETRWSDGAMSIAEFLVRLRELSGKKNLVGSATQAYAPALETLSDTMLVRDPQRQQVSAAQVGHLARQAFLRGEGILGTDLVPRYLRVSEAENRLLLRQKNKGEL